MIAVDQSNVELETNYLINFISPIVRSNDTRQQIVAFIRDILHKSALLEGLIIECGSSALKSYLPESDLDLVLLAPASRSNREEIQCLTSIFNSWCDEIADKDEGKSSHADMTIRNVEFVNARTKLAHCLVNNISVDVTVNQIGAILTLTFLEEADRLIGCNHLFKRSLLLIKTWCLHESARYCGSPITGAKSGMLSSYAVSVLVLHIFNKYTNLTHPFSVLRSFLYTFMSFPWETSVLTIDGVLPLSSFAGAATNSYYSGSGGGSGGGRGYGQDNSDLMSVSTHNSNGSSHSGRARGSFHLPPLPPGPPLSARSPVVTASPLDASNRFQHIVDALARHPAVLLYQQGGSAVHHGRFTAKCCNIQDPVDPFNNLGISVPRASLQLITQACRAGFHHLETMLRRYPHSVPNVSANAGLFASTGVQVKIPSAEEQDPGFAAQVSGDSTGAAKYSAGSVRQMLSPVPPVNLGYVGTVGGGYNNNNNNHNNSHNTSHLSDGSSHTHAQEHIGGDPLSSSLATGASTSINAVPSNVPGGVPSTASSAPYRRNSRTSAPAAGKPYFLVEFFPASLQLYCSAEGEPLRCDLLTHPLQPLSSSSILANAAYSGNSSSMGREHGTPSQTARKSMALSQGEAHADGASVISLTSGVTEQVSSSIVDGAGYSQNYGGGTSGVSPAPQDPLLGDLDAMYEALDLFVSSRRPPRSNAVSATPAIGGSGGGSKKLLPGSTESSVASYQSAPSAGALCAAEIRVLAAIASKPSTPVHTPSQARQTLDKFPGSPFLTQPSAGKPSASKAQPAAGRANKIDQSSPDGSTTSGTESVRQRTSISISDDSVSESTSESGAESESDEDTDSDSLSGRFAAQCDILSLAATAIPYSPPKPAAVPSPSYGTAHTVGSVLAFFRGGKWTEYCAEVGLSWSNSLAGVFGRSPTGSTSAANKESAALPPVQAVASPAVLTGKKRAQQKGDTKVSTTPVSPAGDKKSTAVAAAAAATRRSSSRRTVTTKTQQWLAQWWEARWAELTALAGANTGNTAAAVPVLQRPLVIALLYSVLMILIINLALKAGPDLSGKYAELLGNPTLLSAPYLERWDAVNAWLRASGREVLQRSVAWTTLRNVNQDTSSVATMGAADSSGAGDGDAGSSFDFTVYSASQFSIFGADIGNTVAAHAKKHPHTSPSFLIPPTHWVREGDSVTFGDFGSYGAPAPKGPAPTNSDSASGTSASTAGGSACKPTGARTAPTSSARTTASTTAASVPKVRSVPSESVQKTQYVPKSEYVLAASSVLGSLHSYQWTKDGANVTGDFYHGQPYFSLKRTVAKDAGIYRCYRYDVAVPTAPPVLVMETALQISKPPTVALKPSYHEVKAGTTMVLNLAAEGTPPPVFQWFKNGYPVPGLTAQVLLMEGVNASHSGTYSCDVQNVAGRVLWLEATILVVD